MVCTTTISIYSGWVGFSGLSLFTGLEYWTEVFSFFGQDYVVFQIFDTWRPQLARNYRISVILQQYNDFMTVVVLLAFSNALANKLMMMTSQGII